MSTRRKLGPEVEIDENGKLWCLPLKVPPEFQFKESSSGRKSKSSRACINLPLQRLDLNPADLEDSPKHPAKVRKVDKSVRKELFKVPQNSASRRSVQTTISRPSSNKLRKLNQTKFQQGVAPLSDIHEDGIQPRTSTNITRGYPFKSPSKPVINFVKQNKEKVKFASALKTPNENATKEPNISPDNEFLELEKSCATPKNVRIVAASPSSAICNLLRRTSISDKEITASRNEVDDKIESSNLAGIVQNMRDIIIEDEKEFQMFQQAHENRIRRFTSILESLETFESNNKENCSPRRSGRLAARRSSSSNENISVQISITSPTISKGVDLRKNTLNKNLVRNIRTELMTPRGNKAANMYMAIKTEFPFLCTPKQSAQTPKTFSSRKSIVNALQSQLLSLQQTPTQKQ